jgi:hypothetical protein
MCVISISVFAGQGGACKDGPSKKVCVCTLSLSLSLSLSSIHKYICIPYIYKNVHPSHIDTHRQTHTHIHRKNGWGEGGAPCGHVSYQKILSLSFQGTWGLVHPRFLSRSRVSKASRVKKK